MEFSFSYQNMDILYQLLAVSTNYRKLGAKHYEQKYKKQMIHLAYQAYQVSSFL